MNLSVSVPPRQSSAMVSPSPRNINTFQDNGNTVCPLFYHQIFCLIRSQKMILGVHIGQLSNYDGPTQADKDAAKELSEITLGVLTATYANLFQIVKSSVDSIEELLSTTSEQELRKIGYSILNSLASLRRILVKMTKWYEVQDETIEETEVEINSPPSPLRKQMNVNSLPMITSKSSLNLAGSLKQPPLASKKETTIKSIDDNLVQCRICEKWVPEKMFIEHMEHCYSAVKMKETLSEADRKIRQFQEECQKGIVIPWPSDENTATVTALPTLHIVILLDLLFSDKFATTENMKKLCSKLIETLNSIQSSSRTPLITSLVEKAKPLISQKANQFSSMIYTYTRAQRLTLQPSPTFQGSSLEATIADFEFLNAISSGAFARVYLARKCTTNDIFAIKVISKNILSQKSLLNHIILEKDILLRFNSLYVIQFCKNNLYIVMEYLPGGDLGSTLNQVECFDEESSRTYVCEIVKALGYLRQHKIVHRDLKPENILIDKAGHLKLADFGLSQAGFNSRSLDASKSPCGTPGYAAPEIVLGREALYATDYWSLGVILFEFLTGVPPFNAPTLEQTFMNTLQGVVPMEEIDGFSPEVRDLIQKLLISDPKKRLGYNSIDEIMKHPWFSGIDWDHIDELPPPFVPSLENDEDIAYFNEKGKSRVNFQLNIETEGDIIEDMDAACKAKKRHSSISSLSSLFFGGSDDSSSISYDSDLSEFPSYSLNAVQSQNLRVIGRGRAGSFVEPPSEDSHIQKPPDIPTSRSFVVGSPNQRVKSPPPIIPRMCPSSLMSKPRFV